MSNKFDSGHIEKELFGIFIDGELDISSDEYKELLEELIPLIEDVYYKGYERGRVITEQTLRKIEVDTEANFEDITTDKFPLVVEEYDLFPSEPE
jgi:hypothetical protein